MLDRIPKDFVTTIYSKEGPKNFILLAGLLNLAHEDGLKQVHSKLLQHPSEHNGHLAIVQIQVTTDKGVFTATGDASPENVSKMVACHTVRMAETRALARALRWATNVAMTAFEELGEVDDVEKIAPPSPPDLKKAVQRPITQTQSQAIERLSHYLGWSAQQLSEEVNFRFSVALNELDRHQASSLIRDLQQQKQEAMA